MGCRRILRNTRCLYGKKRWGFMFMFFYLFISLFSYSIKKEEQELEVVGKFPFEIFWNIGARNFEIWFFFVFLNSWDYGNLNPKKTSGNLIVSNWDIWEHRRQELLYKIFFLFLNSLDYTFGFRGSPGVGFQFLQDL